MCRYIVYIFQSSNIIMIHDKDSIDAFRICLRSPCANPPNSIPNSGVHTSAIAFRYVCASFLVHFSATLRQMGFDELFQFMQVRMIHYFFAFYA
jgi:hypothetical protein